MKVSSSLVAIMLLIWSMTAIDETCGAMGEDQGEEEPWRVKRGLFDKFKHIYTHHKDILGEIAEIFSDDHSIFHD